MDMDDVFNSKAGTEECKSVKASDLVAKLKAQSNEETNERFHKFLEEVSSIFEFATQRLEEVLDEYEEFAALGDFGVVVSATLQDKPLVYSAMGDAEGIRSAMKLAMLRTMASVMKRGISSGEEGNEKE